MRQRFTHVAVTVPRQLFEPTLQAKYSHFRISCRVSRGYLVNCEGLVREASA